LAPPARHHASCWKRSDQFSQGAAGLQDAPRHSLSTVVDRGKPQDATRYNVTRLRNGAKALLRAIRQRWSIENSWHWVWDVPLREDAHR